MLHLPRTATAPFCPSEVRGSIDIREDAPWWRRLLQFAGPGLLVAVGYLDPGNWATDIEAGSQFGYSLLWVVLVASFAAMILQILSLRLGLVTGKDLARHCREQLHPRWVSALWLMAELAIIATDLAEVLGCALAFHLLLHVSMAWGVALTALDTLIVLGLKGRGFRQIEAIILALILTIATCFVIQLYHLPPQWRSLMAGLLPQAASLHEPQAWWLTLGILGATVMPHNLYLHSSIVQTRKVTGSYASALRLATADTVASLLLACVLNGAILTLAASAFFTHNAVHGIEQAHQLLEPLWGSQGGSWLFAVALLAAGQSSTFTGTISAQVLMEGFLKLQMPCWQRRLITRSLALAPALIGVLWLGDGAVDRLLVFSQVVLSILLPFTIYPLLRFTGSSALMGPFANGRLLHTLSWILFIMISAANLWLVIQFVTHG